MGLANVLSTGGNRQALRDAGLTVKDGIRGYRISRGLLDGRVKNTSPRCARRLAGAAGTMTNMSQRWTKHEHWRDRSGGRETFIHVEETVAKGWPDMTSDQNIEWVPPR